MRYEDIHVVTFSRPYFLKTVLSYPFLVRALSHALKIDILADTSASIGGVLHAEQTSLSSKPYYMTPLSKKGTL